jgi:hypothetical protein
MKIPFVRGDDVKLGSYGSLCLYAGQRSANCFTMNMEITSLCGP